MATESDTRNYKTAAILLAAIALEYFAGCKPHEAQAAQPTTPRQPRVLEFVRQDAKALRQLERHTREDRRALNQLIASLNK